MASARGPRQDGRTVDTDADGRTSEAVVKFEITKDKAGEFRFRLVATNGNVLAASEGYTAKASAQAAIDRIKSDAAGASVVDNS